MPIVSIEKMIKDVRITVLSAAVWKIIAELMRRHAHSHEVTLIEAHPGISVRGCMHVMFDADMRDPGQARQLILHLGGPSGTFEVSGSGTDTTREPQDYFFTLLTGDPARFMDSLDRRLRLSTPKPLPPSSPDTLVARAIAECLQRKMLSRRFLRTTMAWVDASAYGPYIAKWGRHFVPDVDQIAKWVSSGEMDWTVGFARLKSYLALHYCGESDEMLTCDPQGAAALFSMLDGDVLLIQGDALRARINLSQEYLNAGRRLGPAVDQILAHLA